MVIFRTELEIKEANTSLFLLIALALSVNFPRKKLKVAQKLKVIQDFITIYINAILRLVRRFFENVG